jgi:hypothetical protein
MRLAPIAPIARFAPFALLASLSAQGAPDHTRAERAVTSLDRAAGFYERLGFTVQRSADGRAVAELGETRATFRRAKASSAQADSPLLVLVPELAPVRQDLVDERMPFTELRASPSGRRSLRVVDPDGWPVLFRTKVDQDAVVVPGPGELNPIVLEVIVRYPTDGTHRYWWPRGGEGKGWTGCTKDLEYAGEVFATGDPKGRCYCCGLTFEVLVDAWRIWCRRNARPWRIADLDVAGVRRLQRQWFGSAGGSDRTLVCKALIDNDLGTRVENLEDARPGDFVQLWRESGSGHSVVFLEWLRDGDGDGEITGVLYWSTQGATQGIGERKESFVDGGKKRLLRDQFYIGRVGVPPRRSS